MHAEQGRLEAGGDCQQRQGCLSAPDHLSPQGSPDSLLIWTFIAVTGETAALVTTDSGLWRKLFFLSIGRGGYRERVLKRACLPLSPEALAALAHISFPVQQHTHWDWASSSLAFNSQVFSLIVLVLGAEPELSACEAYTLPLSYTFATPSHPTP